MSFSESDIELLQLVANRVALSIERSRLMVQGQIAATLQRSLLPRKLPQVTGLRMAARYLPAADQSAVGGDWYDVIELDNPCVGFVIGDVAGHGMAAATFMGQLRSAIRAYALDTDGPGEVITKLAEFSDRMHSRMATVIYATLNLNTWEVRIARAGHPYPVLVRRRGGGGVHLKRGWAADRDRRRACLRRADPDALGGGDPGALHGWVDRATRGPALGWGGGADRGGGRRAG